MISDTVVQLFLATTLFENHFKNIVFMFYDQLLKCTVKVWKILLL